MLESDAPDAIDARRFRDTLGHYASGITVVSGWHADKPVGFTCQSFYSVSAEPPLVSFSVMHTSTSYPPIQSTGRFAVNVLSRHQQHVSAQFARSGTDKWAGIDWIPTAAGNPVIRDTVMWVDCEVWAEHVAGDHLIIIGKVLEISPAEWCSGDPLIFYRGAYRELQNTGT